jgi:homoserine kinase
LSAQASSRLPVAMGNDMLLPARVRVPASTSNLGSGFDCLGLAFELHLDAVYEPGEGDLSLQREGTLAKLPDRASDLVMRVFRRDFERRGRPVPGGRIVARSDIPVGRGLGSSATAIVAGFALAAASRGETLDLAVALDAATRLEGHPDNAAPALLGGLVAVAHDTNEGLHPFRLPLSGALAFGWAAPGVEVSTAAARAALPGRIAHEVAIRALSRTAALLHGLAHADPDLLRIGFSDELHVPHRLPLIPGAAEAIEAATGVGAWAVTISGSGSGLIAVGPPGSAERISDAMAKAFQAGARNERERTKVISRTLVPDLTGARILPV